MTRRPRRPKPLVTAALSDPREAHPLRIRWVRRFVLLLIAIWIALIGTWVAMYRAAGARLEREMQAARQRGELVEIGAFAPAPVRPEDNALPYLQRADSLYKPNPEETPDNWESLHTFPLTPAALRTIRRHVEVNSAALAELRRARSRSGAEWHPPFGATQADRERAGIETYSLSNGTQRLSDLLEWSAMEAQQGHGDDAEAVERALDLLALAHHVRFGTGLAAYTMQMSLFDTASVTTRELAARLNDPRATTRPASREQITAVIHSLLDEHDRVDRLRRTFFGERAEVIDSFNGRFYQWGRHEDGNWGAFPLTRTERFCQAVTLPYYRRTMADHVEELTRIGRAAESVVDYASLSKQLPPPPRRSNRSWQNTLSGWLDRNRYNAADRLLYQDFIYSTQCRCSAVLLALRLYQLDHDGRFPNQLSELVGGGYLPAVPLDPMAAGGRPLGYGRNGGTVYVYSVGTDGRDDIAAGTFKVDVDFLNSWERSVPDYVTMLDRRLASPPPTTAPATTTPSGPASP